MKPLDPKPLLESDNSPYFRVLLWQVSQNEAAEWFDHEPYRSVVEGVGDAELWAVEFDCGLQVIFEFVKGCSRGLVYANEPVAEHIKRHFPVQKSQLVDPPAGSFQHEATTSKFAEEFPELLKLQSFQVWRQGDDGNAMKVGEPTSRRDAECRVAEFESHHHKQIYWVSRVAR